MHSYLNYIDCFFFSSGSNDGWIKVWKLKKSESSFDNDLVCEANADVRITCLCSYTKRNNQTNSRKQKSGETEAEDMMVEEEEVEKKDEEDKNTKRLNKDSGDSTNKSSKKVKFS